MIDSLRQYLAGKLAQVDEHILAVTNSETVLMREVGQYVLDGHGKKLRPMMVLLSSSISGYEGGKDVQLAAALELIHTATLLHDDVIDKATLRRGRPTVNSKWDDDVAILVADYLYSHAFRMAMQTLSSDVLSLVCQVTAKMCEGEMFQIEKTGQLLTHEDYLRIVRHKTAYLFSACTGLGSVLADAAEEQVAALADFGLNFGIAFQITDDTLDFVAQDSDVGKERWTDIRNGKQTLALIYTLGVANPVDREDLWSCWCDGRDGERIMRHINCYKGIEHALDVARQYARRAKEALARFQPSRDLELLLELADYVGERRN